LLFSPAHSGCPALTGAHVRPSFITKEIIRKPDNAGATSDVAQASKPAVSQVSKPAECSSRPKPSECHYRVRIEGRAAMESCKLDDLRAQKRKATNVCRESDGHFDGLKARPSIHEGALSLSNGRPCQEVTSQVWNPALRRFRTVSACHLVSCTVTLTGSRKSRLNAATSFGCIRPFCSHSRYFTVSGFSFSMVYSK